MLYGHRGRLQGHGQALRTFAVVLQQVVGHALG
jgi:hypothetical protein